MYTDFAVNSDAIQSYNFREGNSSLWISEAYKLRQSGINAYVEM